uniref:Uncharacterized protein n=1 Tax=Rhizophagus irregularis (strain DAOM 181602 / DAOM 197198 / MUCL 43194) TaxID=747089 RepID=U9TMF4_RHIID
MTSSSDLRSMIWYLIVDSNRRAQSIKYQFHSSTSSAHHLYQNYVPESPNSCYQLPFKVRLKGNFKKVDFLRVHESKQFLLRRELRVWVVVEEVRLLLALAAALVSLVYWAMIEGREQQKKLFLKKQ